MAVNVNGLREALAEAVDLLDLTMTTGLPAVVSGTANNLDVARSLPAYLRRAALPTRCCTLFARRGCSRASGKGESAMLVARGATRWQLIGLTLLSRPRSLCVG